MGILDNFESAYAEFERHREAPYDRGGALYDYEQDAQLKDDAEYREYLKMQGK